jgi:hypothetical protein
MKELGYIPDKAGLSCEAFMSLVQNRSWHGISGSFNHPDDFKQIVYHSPFGVVSIHMDMALNGFDAYVGPDSDWYSSMLIEKIFLGVEN